MHRLSTELGIETWIYSFEVPSAYLASAVHTLWAGRDILRSIGTNIIEATGDAELLGHMLREYLTDYVRARAISLRAGMEDLVTKMSETSRGTIYIAGIGIVPVSPMPNVENMANIVAAGVGVSDVLVAQVPNRGTLLLIGDTIGPKNLVRQLGAEVLFAASSRVLAALVVGSEPAEVAKTVLEYLQG